ncbi:MAG TPA: hypothetical protein VF636_02300, partial [Sphingomonas sp.]
ELRAAAEAVTGLARRLASALLALLLLANAPDGLDAAVARWLDAFNRLDWPAFRAAFASDATVFHPSPADGAGRRVDQGQVGPDRAALPLHRAARPAVRPAFGGRGARHLPSGRGPVARSPHGGLAP